MHAYLESLDASVFVLMTNDVCCRIAYRMLWLMVAGMIESGMHFVHLV
jgi:hypothetical protein